MAEQTVPAGTAWSRLINAVLDRWVKVRCLWHRWVFNALEKPRHRSVEIGRNVLFHAPVRGGAGRLSIGSGCIFGYWLAHRLGSGAITLQAREPGAEVIVGDGTMINNNAVICALQRVRIGRDCRIGDYVAIMDSDFHEVSPATRNRSPGVIAPVEIGNNVWIGSRAMVLKGVTIGDNSVVSAMSVVMHDIPANCVAAGMPAKVIRTLE